MNKVNSLYIHIPFCEQICDYCDFTKLQYFRNMAKPYIESLKKEIKEKVDNLDLKTIYIGGGTPTSLENDLFEDLLTFLEPYTKNVEEYTVECNPESLSIEKLTLMKEHKVNRLSIGVESTNDKILHSINRKHTFEDVKTAVLRAKEIGFDDINLDLIIGLPNVSKALFMEDLCKITDLNVEHISCYSLTVHEHTVFFNKNVKEPDDEFSRELYDYAHEYLNKKGYTHYEISNWAKKGHESKHNLTYWRNNQYYGCGLGASGYEGKVRYTNTKNISKYLKGSILDYKEELTEEDEMEYQIILNLRTLEGIDLIEFKRRYNVDLLITKKEAISELICSKLLKKDIKNHLIPTYEGMMILDQIILKII